MTGQQNQHDKYKRLIKFSAAAVILAAELLIYAFIWFRRYNPMLHHPFYRRGHWLILLLYGVLLLLFSSMYGALRVGLLRRGNLIYSQILTITIVNVITYIEIMLMDMRLHSPMLILMVEAGEIIVIVLWALLFHWLYARLFPPRQMLLVYGTRPAFHLMEKMNSRDDKYILTHAVNARVGVEEIMEEARHYDAVVIGDIPSHNRNRIMKECYDLNIRTYTVPKLSDILLRSSDELNIFDSPLYLSRNDGLAIEQELVKRLGDILVSLLMLLVSSPFFLIIMLLIKLNDGGPVFYKQRRLTKDGQEFYIYKFRTMVVDAEKQSGPRLAGEDDPRITRVGRFLRACRMDELPQLLNILRGEMSMVGPRPERPELAAEIEKEIPEFSYRLKVKAGLTGYAQVYGKYNTTSYDKLKLDLTYIRNYSVLLDIKLILMTPKVLFLKESTEGVEDNYVDRK